MTLIFTTQSAAITAAVSTTFTVTHGLGVVPDFVTVNYGGILPAAIQGDLTIVGLTAQVVLLVATRAANPVINLKAESFHSIIK